MNNVEFITIKSNNGKENGNLYIVEEKDINFSIKRAYYVTSTQDNNIRGYHAHKELWQAFFAIKGKIDVCCEDTQGNKETFILDNPQKGLICGPMIWHTLTYHDSAILLTLASNAYNENDYIRDYEEFKEYGNTSK